MYVRGVGAFMLMHETRMHENYNLKWSQTWPLFFIFVEGNRRKTLFFLFYSFCLFFRLSPKKKRIRNKKDNREEENRKKFSIVNKSFFWLFSAKPFCFFDNPTPPFFCPYSGIAILCLRQSDTVSFLFSTTRHRHFFGLIQAQPFCVYDNPTRLVSHFRLCETVIF